MKAVVIGGTGFVGMNVTRALVAAGHDVVATRKVHANTLFARKLGAPLVRADLDDEPALVEAMRGREVAFMCAGHYPRYSLDADAEVAVARARVGRALSAAKQAHVSRVVLTSSIATVGPPERGVRSTEDDPIDPTSLGSVYHRVKLAIEQEALASGLDVVVLLPTGIVGELDVKAGTGFLFVALGNGMLPFFVEGKTNVIDADDLAHAHVAAALHGRSGERYAVGGHDLMVSELLERVATILGVPMNARPVPWWLAGPAATFAEMRAAALKDGGRPFLAREMVDVVRFGRFVDSSKAARELRLPPPTPLDDTLRKACGWFVKHRYIRLPSRVSEGVQGVDHAPRPDRTDRARPRDDHPPPEAGALR